MELNRGRPPSPYDGLLKEISIALKPNAKVYIGQEEERMIISGSQEYLPILAEDIKHIAEHPISSSAVLYHIHIKPVA